jgi:hypothetical protein
MKLGKDARVGLTMTKELKERFQIQARQRQMHLSDWFIQAALSYEKTGKKFGKRYDVADIHSSGWPVGYKCPFCLKRSDHDPLLCDRRFEQELPDDRELYR